MPPPPQLEKNGTFSNGQQQAPVFGRLRSVFGLALHNSHEIER